MAKLVMEWIPDDVESFSIKKTETSIPDDADVYDMFEVWKEQMSFLGYLMNDYFIDREESSNYDYPIVEDN